MECDTYKMKEIKECSSVEKQIVVVHIKDRSDVLEINKHYCQFLPPKEIKYKINYISVFLDDMSELERFIAENEDTLSNKCNRLLVYVEWIFFEDSTKQMEDLEEGHEVSTSPRFPGTPVRKPANPDKVRSILSNVLLVLKPFPIYKTLYNAFDDFKLKQTETKDTFNVNKTYNLQRGIGSFYIYEKHDIFYLEMPYLYFKMKKTDKNLLTCQLWFRKYLSTLYSCGKGRLIQIAGTCYLNSAINVFLLGDHLRSFVIDAMNRYLQMFPDSRKYITSRLTKVYACPNIYGGVTHQRLRFLFRIIYNTICKSERQFPRAELNDKEDIMIETSAELFTGVLPLGDTEPERRLRSNKLERGGRGYGEGGNPFYVFARLIKDLNLNMAISRFNKLESRNEFKKIDDVSLPYRVEEFEEFPSKYAIQMTIPDDADIIFYNPLSVEDMEIELDDLFPNFVCENALISIYGKGGHHAIMGFKCDGIPKIYDSALNHITEVDWTNTATAKSSIEEQTTFFYKSIQELKNITIVYVNRRLAV